MSIYYSGTHGVAGGEIVRHADTVDRRTRRRVGGGYGPGEHRAAGKGREWGRVRVNAWPGVALVLLGACVVLIPLAVVSVTVGAPGVSNSSYHPLWPWSNQRHPVPTVRETPAQQAPGGVFPEPSGQPTASGSPSDGPVASSNPPRRPDPEGTEAPQPPPLPPDATPSRSEDSPPTGASPSGSVSPTCPPTHGNGNSNKDKSKPNGLTIVPAPGITLKPPENRSGVTAP